MNNQLKIQKLEEYAQKGKKIAEDISKLIENIEINQEIIIKSNEDLIKKLNKILERHKILEQIPKLNDVIIIHDKRFLLLNIIIAGIFIIIFFRLDLLSTTNHLFSNFNKSWNYLGYLFNQSSDDGKLGAVMIGFSIIVSIIVGILSYKFGQIRERKVQK